MWICPLKDFETFFLDYIYILFCFCVSMWIFFFVILCLVYFQCTSAGLLVFILFLFLLSVPTLNAVEFREKVFNNEEQISQLASLLTFDI